MTGASQYRRLLKSWGRGSNQNGTTILILTIAPEVVCHWNGIELMDPEGPFKNCRDCLQLGTPTSTLIIINRLVVTGKR